MAPSSRKGPAQTKKIFDNHRYFVIPKGKGDATCRNCGDAVPRPNYNTSSMHKHLEIHHPSLWAEAERNADAAGKAFDKDKEKLNGGVKKPAKEKPKRRVIIEDSDDDEPSTTAAAAPAQPVENPQMGRRGTLEGDWPVERIEAMRVAQNGQDALGCAYIGAEMSKFGDCRIVRSVDGYYALCEYEERADAVEAKSRLHHSREPWVLRKEHASGYWAHKAATGLQMDSISRPKALECLDNLGFPNVDGGWDSVLLRKVKKPRLSHFYRDALARIYADEADALIKAKEAERQKEDRRRRIRTQLALPDYDSFDEDFDATAESECGSETRRSRVRSQLSIPDYDSFDEDF